MRGYIKNNLKQEIYRNLQKRQQNKINNELNKLKFDELAKKKKKLIKMILKKLNNIML